MCIRDRFKREQEEANQKSKLEYYDTELRRLDEIVDSNPKIRALNHDIRKITAQMISLEKEQFGVSATEHKTLMVKEVMEKLEAKEQKKLKPDPKPELKPVQPESESDSDESFEPPIPPRRTEGRPMYPKIIQNAKVGKR